jgi:AbrB family looped-hinge helix DNA binding protein
MRASDLPLTHWQMRIGDRGQVTIPKHIRDQFGLGPKTEVEFRVVNSNIVLRKAPKKLNLTKWKGYCGKPSLSSAIPPWTRSWMMYVADNRHGTGG